MPATPYTRNLIAVAYAHGTSYQGPATVYLRLTSTTPTASTPGTEVTYDTYEPAEFDNTVSGTGWVSDGVGGLTNAADITFPVPTTGIGDYAVGVEAWTAASSGTRLWYADLETMVDITPDVPTVVFKAGELAFSVT